MKKKSLLITGALAASILAAPATSFASSDDGHVQKSETYKVEVNHVFDWFKQNEDQIRNGEFDLNSFLDQFQVEPKAPVQQQPQPETPVQEAPAPEAEEPAPETEQPAPETEQPAPEAEQPAPEVEEPQQEQDDETNSEVSAFEQEVVELTNDERTERGLEPLQLDTELAAVAKDKSLDMLNNDYFSHTSPTYGSPFDMMQAYGVDYRAAGENIAMGQQSPEQVVNAWMNSEGHRQNILSPNFTHIGVGHTDDGNYWTQMFIGK
ncbi:CAP domain-containing protein [Halobacillus litoralis]|uniref:CAP domain-containing protein n=1 Tax=Halobacillus litoralis TaxID=45668 RepID=UPI001CD27B13|nr:CAP domain-containing protein [Halobacillus litoralis]MCA0972060.1 CAP domain-containing protein [Halobacillus litoralis]